MQILQEQITKIEKVDGKVCYKDYILLMNQFIKAKGGGINIQDGENQKQFFKESLLRIKNLQKKQQNIDKLQHNVQELEILNEKQRKNIDALSKQNESFRNQIAEQQDKLEQQDEIIMEMKRNYAKLDNLLRKSKQDNINLRNVVVNIQKFKDLSDNVKIFNDLINQEQFKLQTVLEKACDIDTVQNYKNLFFQYNHHNNYLLKENQQKILIFQNDDKKNKLNKKKDFCTKIKKIIGVSENCLFALKDDCQTIIQYNLERQKLVRELLLEHKVRLISNFNNNKIAYLTEDDYLGYIQMHKKIIKNCKKDHLIKIPEVYDILLGIYLHQDNIYLGLSDCRILKIQFKEEQNAIFDTIDLANSFLINDIKIVFNKIMLVITEEAVFVYDLDSKRVSTQILIHENVTCLDSDDLKFMFGTKTGEIEIYDTINGLYLQQFKASECSIANISYDSEQEAIYTLDIQQNLKKFSLEQKLINLI